MQSLVRVVPAALAQEDQAMSTWEERMSARHAQRQRDRIPDPLPDLAGHEGHHGHMAHGSIECSCGEMLGVICYVIDGRYFSNDPALIAQARREEEDFDAWVTCSVCGKTGVQYQGDFGKPFGPGG